MKQLTVFVQNKKGTVVSVTELLARNNINLRALSIAETQEFGILRLVVNDEKAAEAVLAENGYLIKVIDVIGVKIGDAPGKLTAALSVLDQADINVEYLYAFMARTEKHAYVVLRVADNAAAETVLLNEGYQPNYQIVVDRVSNNDTFEVNVEMPQEQFTDKVSEILAKEKALANAMKAMLGINPAVHLVPPKSIVRSEGKAVRVIDKRKLID